MRTNDIVISAGDYNSPAIDLNNSTFSTDGVHDVMFNKFIDFNLHQ